MKIKKTIEVELEIVPCVKCDTTDVQIIRSNVDTWRNDDFLAYWIKCTNCGHSLESSTIRDERKTIEEQIIEIWNREPSVYFAKIDRLKREIHELKKLPFFDRHRKRDKLTVNHE